MKRMRLYKDKKKFRVYTKKRIKHKNKIQGGASWFGLFGPAAGASISYTLEKPFLIFSKLKLVLTGKTEVGPSSRRKINQKVVDKILDIIALIPVDVF